MAYGFAYRDADPARALEAMHRGLVIAHDSGNRFNETHLVANLAQVEVERGDPLAALDHITLAIRNLHDSGNVVQSPFPSDKPRGRSSTGSDATSQPPPSQGSHSVPYMALAFPEINTAIAQLRDVLGDQTYESLARKGETMTTAEMATYAYDQIDQARAELNAVSE